MGSNINEVWIAADGATVFAALTTREGLDGWWGPVDRAEPTVGSVVAFDHGLSEPLRMEVIELVPDQRVVWRCVSVFHDADNPASEWHGQTFTFDIEPRRVRELVGTEQDVTVVRMRNDGWPDGATWQGFCNTAWGVTLEDKLKPFCESGSVSSGMVGEG